MVNALKEISLTTLHKHRPFHSSFHLYLKRCDTTETWPVLHVVTSELVSSMSIFTINWTWRARLNGMNISWLIGYYYLENKLKLFMTLVYLDEGVRYDTSWWKIYTGHCSNVSDIANFSTLSCVSMKLWNPLLAFQSLQPFPNWKRWHPLTTFYVI